MTAFPVKLACLQSSGTPRDVSANLAELDARAGEAAAAGASVLVTPELFLTGYDIGDAGELAREPLTRRTSEIARRHGMAIVVGMPRWTDAGLTNAAVFVDEEGHVRATHAKTHLFGELDRTRFVAGDEAVTMVGYRGVNVALMICYDVEFPESVRAAALRGAHLVATPTAQMVPFDWVAETVIPVRAWENQIYVCYANRIGSERETVYVGRSSIVAPDGAKLASSGLENTLLFADIEPRRVRRAQRENPYLSDLRTDLYPTVDSHRRA